jgi:hypothetical protein
MTLRDHCTDAELDAHELLDMVRAGIDVPDSYVVAALAILGESLE